MTLVETDSGMHVVDPAGESGQPSSADYLDPPENEAEEDQGRVYGLRFAAIPDALVWDTEMTDGAVRLYCALARYAGSEHRVFFGVKTLGALLGLNPGTVRRRMRQLEMAGYVRVEARYREDGSQTANDYYLDTSEQGT